MWQRLISISLSISQVMGMDAFSFSNWATFMLILWYSDMQVLFHLDLCVCECVCVPSTCVFKSVYYSKCAECFSILAIPNFTARWSHCSVFMESDKEWHRRVELCCVLYLLVLCLKSSRVICLIMNLTAHTLIVFSSVSSECYPHLHPSWTGSRPLSLTEVTASLWTSLWPSLTIPAPGWPRPSGLLVGWFQVFLKVLQKLCVSSSVLSFLVITHQFHWRPNSPTCVRY